MPARQALAPAALSQLFTDARSHHHWTDRKVSDDLLRTLYELVKWGPRSWRRCWRPCSTPSSQVRPACRPAATAWAWGWTSRARSRAHGGELEYAYAEPYVVFTLRLPA